MYILFDIGGTKTRVVATDREKFISEPVIVSTPKNFEEGIDTIKNIINNLANGGQIEAIIGGIAGPINSEKTSLANSPNLSGWVGKNIKEALSSAYNVPVFLENDSALVALGEAHFGAGKGFPIVVYLTISTGVGGARIVDGVIDRSSMGFEPGHQLIDPNKTMCPDCDGNGDLESLVSGTSVEKRFGKKPYEIHDSAVWDQLAKFLAYGIHNTILHWSPDVIVLGGSMTKEVGIPIEGVRKHLEEYMKIFPKIPELKKSELEDFGGLYGALAYAQSQQS